MLSIQAILTLAILTIAIILFVFNPPAGRFDCFNGIVGPGYFRHRQRKNRPFPALAILR